MIRYKISSLHIKPSPENTFWDICALRFGTIIQILICFIMKIMCMTTWKLKAGKLKGNWPLRKNRLHT